jgi:cell division GTPase FtsZ
MMNVLLLGVGGGGGNILRSLKALFDRDLTVSGHADPAFAKRLRRAVSTRFLDTNEFALTDVPAAERLLIGSRTTGRLGARHNPEVARQALEESRAEVEALMRQHSVIVLLGTGGKGTGAGTMFPLAELAREQRKLLIPVFVRPSFEWHEVDKRRYDHALQVIERFDAAKIRFIEILNDRGYLDSDPQPQHVVWERMNLPIARGLRGLIYVLWELSQVDPSDLSMLFAGNGRLRMGFAELDPPVDCDPGDAEVEQAVRRCWSNPYCAFSKPTGTSLICIQGDWSNVVDAKIKRGLGAAAIGDNRDGPYNPLYARAAGTPRPWGVTALFAEHTGAHPPLEVDWSFDRRDLPLSMTARSPASASVKETSSPPGRAESVIRPALSAAPLHVDGREREGANPGPRFSNVWDFAIAVNRSDPDALALAQNGSDGGFAIDRGELRKLLGTVWFRSVFQRLSGVWHRRLFDVLRDQLPIQNWTVQIGRRSLPLSEVSYAQLNELAERRDLADPMRGDVHLLLAVGRLWGEDALRECQFLGDAEAQSTGAWGGLFRWAKRQPTE